MVSDDGVYLHDDRQVREYVENDVGKVWNGTYKNYFGRPWNFGQFEDINTILLAFLQNYKNEAKHKKNIYPHIFSQLFNITLIKFKLILSYH